MDKLPQARSMNSLVTGCHYVYIVFKLLANTYSKCPICLLRVYLSIVECSSIFHEYLNPANMGDPAISPQSCSIPCSENTIINSLSTIMTYKVMGMEKQKQFLRTDIDTLSLVQCPPGVLCNRSKLAN